MNEPISCCRLLHAVVCLQVADVHLCVFLEHALRDARYCAQTLFSVYFREIIQKSSCILLRPFPLVYIQQIAAGKLGKGKDVGKHIHFSVKVIVQGQGH